MLRDPSPFTSRALNNSLSSLISSGEACTEMAVSATCFIFDVFWKFLKAFNFVPSITFDLSFFSPFNCFLNHLWPSASCAVSLFSGLQINFLIRSLASFEISSHSSPSKSNLPF